MKYFKYLMIGLLAASFFTGTIGNTFAAETRIKTKDIKGLKIRKAEIRSLKIGTEPDGTWTWTAVVKNTGNTLIKKNSMSVQGLQGTSAASGSILPSDLAAGNSVSVKNFWTRCCGSTALKVDLRDNLKSPSTVISTKTIPIPEIKLRVTKIVWNNSQKKWTATVKNDTSLSIKIVIQGVATHANPIHWVGAGGFTKVVPPNGTVNQTGSWSAYQPGDLLGVELRYFDQKWCGGSGWCKIHYKQITLP